MASIVTISPFKSKDTLLSNLESKLEPELELDLELEPELDLLAGV